MKDNFISKKLKRAIQWLQKKSPKWWENGQDIFIKYNYYIVLIGFFILILGVKFYNYLDNLNSTYNIQLNIYDDYKEFLEHYLILIDILFWLFIIIYIYAFISFLLASFEKKNKPITLDPLVINLIYFTVLLIQSFLLSNNDWYSIYFVAIIISLASIVFLILSKKYSTEIESYGDIISKSLIFTIISFFIINYKHLIETIRLIKIDTKNNISIHMKAVIKDKKEKVLIKVKQHINSDKNITILENKSELYIIIQKEKIK